MQDNTTPYPSDAELQAFAADPTQWGDPEETLTGEAAAAAGRADLEAAGFVQAPAIVCGSCGRERTTADDYDYNPLQLVTGRPLGWYSNDDGEFCGTCLGAMMSGAWPANHQANPEKTSP